MELQQLYQKIRNSERITPEEGLFLLQKAPWLEIAQLASERRAKRVDEKAASYTMFRIINYTSVCNVGCLFCSFQDKPDAPNAYTLTKEEVFEKIDHAIEMDADQVFFQGGVNPDLPFEYYTDILSSIKKKYGVHIRAFSPVEIKSMAEISGQTIDQTLKVLKEAGLDSVPGAGAEMLVERVREILSPEKCTTEEWVDIMKRCHKLGLPGSANIVIGSVETEEEIIEHLNVVRSIQDETGGFQSFIPWTFQPQTKQFERKKIPHQYYLKVLGLSRIFLDNIDNIEVSVMVLGKDIGKLALLMGANDISSPVIEENVLRSYGLKTEKEAVKLIEDAGLKAVRRDFNYHQA